jgi:hypothetical protein
MDSEAFVAASLLWVDLIVIHHKTSDTLRLALYQIIDRNWQNYEQGIMSQPQIINELKERSIIEICHRIKKSSDAQYVVVQSTNW